MPVRILEKGQRPGLVFDPYSFRMPIVYLTLSMLCRGHWKKQLDDRWEEDADYFDDMYESLLTAALSTVVLRSDDDEDGTISDGEQETYTSVRLML